MTFVASEVVEKAGELPEGWNKGEHIQHGSDSLQGQINICQRQLPNTLNAIENAEANQVNRMHISTIGDYSTCIQRLKSLEREYKEWDFSKVNFSQTDTEKMRLNIAIKKYNESNLKLMDYKLYDVFEAQRIAKEEADEAIK